MNSQKPSLFVRILLLVGIIALIVGLFLTRDQLVKLQKYGYVGIFLIFLSLIPNLILDVAGMASGVLKVPAWRFFVPCAIGKILKSLIFSYAGHFSADWLNL